MASSPAPPRLSLADFNHHSTLSTFSTIVVRRKPRPTESDAGLWLDAYDALIGLPGIVVGGGRVLPCTNVVFGAGEVARLPTRCLSERGVSKEEWQQLRVAAANVMKQAANKYQQAMSKGGEEEIRLDVATDEEDEEEEEVSEETENAELVEEEEEEEEEDDEETEQLAAEDESDNGKRAAPASSPSIVVLGDEDDDNNVPPKKSKTNEDE